MIRGAHAFCVLATAFCRRERFRNAQHHGLTSVSKRKFVSAECRNQHATSVRSPDLQRRSSLLKARGGAASLREPATDVRAGANRRGAGHSHGYGPAKPRWHCESGSASQPGHRTRPGDQPRSRPSDGWNADGGKRTGQRLHVRAVVAGREFRLSEDRFQTECATGASMRCLVVS